MGAAHKDMQGRWGGRPRAEGPGQNALHVYALPPNVFAPLVIPDPLYLKPSHCDSRHALVSPTRGFAGGRIPSDVPTRSRTESKRRSNTQEDGDQATFQHAGGRRPSDVPTRWAASWRTMADVIMTQLSMGLAMDLAGAGQADVTVCPIFALSSQPHPVSAWHSTFCSATYGRCPAKLTSPTRGLLVRGFFRHAMPRPGNNALVVINQRSAQTSLPFVIHVCALVCPT